MAYKIPAFVKHLVLFLKNFHLSFSDNLCYLCHLCLLSLKRDTTKLTPADMLALVALVEAGERARKESDMDSGISVPLVDAEELDYVPAAGSWLDAPMQPQQQQQQAPALVDYYGMPVEAQVVPKYEYVPRPQKYLGSNGRKWQQLEVDSNGLLNVKNFHYRSGILEAFHGGQEEAFD